MANPAPGFKTNPTKKLSITPFAGEVTVTAAGKQVAKSSHAMLLREDSYLPVYYVPFADIDFAAMEKTGHASHCPFKGDASYWSVTPLGAGGANAMWAYQHPFDESAAIKDHGAFYPNKVTIEAKASA